MKLHKTPVQAEEATSLVLPSTTKTLAATTAQTELRLTIRFGKQVIKAPGGRVEFGLKRGVLRLRLTNGKIPLEKMGLTNPFEVAIGLEEQQEQGRESEANVSMAGGVKTKDANKRATKMTYKTYQVANRGTEEEPVWVFEAKVGSEPILVGQLTEESLGPVEVNGSLCDVQATFAVPQQSDIHLFDVDGLLRTKNLSRNKTAWATREFFLRFIAPKLQPHLCQVEGQL